MLEKVEDVMKLRIVVLAGILSAAGALAEDQPFRPPIASKPVVTIEGKIRKVQLAMGQGMPYLDVESSDAKVTKVYLGSMRYLMEQNFNPKAGAEVTVKGYKLDPEVIAITVTLPGEKKTLKLRDENGFPVWRGPGMGWRGGEGPHGPGKQ